MALEKVIQPAINLAKNGWILDRYSAASFSKALNRFSKYPSSMKIFSDNGVRYKEGDLFVQKDLAETLIRIKENGNDGFYRGKTADLLVKQINELNGYITHEDLVKYKAVEREPIHGSYRDFDIISMSPPSSGGIALVQMLNILENFTFQTTDWGSSSCFNKLAETMKYVYADRTYHLGDSDFYEVPQNKLVSKEYAKSIFDKLDSNAVSSSEISSNIPTTNSESDETTHYSVYDRSF